MAKRSTRRRISESSIMEKEVVAEKPKPTYNKSSNTVLLRSLIRAHIKYVGPHSNLKFEWPKAGSIVAVPKEDAEVFLEKRLGGKTCCGSDKTRNRIFEIVPKD